MVVVVRQRGTGEGGGGNGRVGTKRGRTRKSKVARRVKGAHRRSGETHRPSLDINQGGHKGRTAQAGDAPLVNRKDLEP